MVLDSANGRSSRRKSERPWETYQKVQPLRSIRHTMTCPKIAKTLSSISGWYHSSAMDNAYLTLLWKARRSVAPWRAADELFESSWLTVPQNQKTCSYIHHGEGTGTGTNGYVPIHWGRCLPRLTHVRTIECSPIKTTSHSAHQRGDGRLLVHTVCMPVRYQDQVPVPVNQIRTINEHVAALLQTYYQYQVRFDVSKW